MSDGRRQVIEQIAWAHGVVDAADVPEDLRVVAFQHALAVRMEMLTRGASRALPLVRAPLNGGPSSDRLSHVAAALRLPEDVVERIYEHDGAGVRLAFPRSLLLSPDSKAASMRHVALLVAVGRQTSGEEDATPFSALRRECAELGVLDGPNFATEVGRLEMRIAGGRNTRVVYVQRHHHGQAAALIRRMVASAEARR